MKSFKESSVPKAVLTPSIEIGLIQKCLWTLHKKFNFQTTTKINKNHFQCLKQSLKALLEIKFPMLISVKSKAAAYNSSSSPVNCGVEIPNVMLYCTNPQVSLQDMWQCYHHLTQTQSLHNHISFDHSCIHWHNISLNCQMH
jgi:hypothetical protein